MFVIFCFPITFSSYRYNYINTLFHFAIRLFLKPSPIPSNTQIFLKKTHLSQRNALLTIHQTRVAAPSIHAHLSLSFSNHISLFPNPIRITTSISTPVTYLRKVVVRARSVYSLALPHKDTTRALPHSGRIGILL